MLISGTMVEKASDRRLHITDSALIPSNIYTEMDHVAIAIMKVATKNGTYQCSVRSMQ